MTTEHGLRERKKLATREAMSRAAWHLMVEHGIAAVTPEAVAEAAGVSPRTFRNYFWAPEQAVVDGIVQRAKVVVDAVRARPADEPIWDSLEHVLPDTLTTIVGTRADIASLMRASQEDPGLLGQHLAALDRLHQLLVDVIAERTGTDPRRELSPRLLAMAAADAMSAATAVWAFQEVDDDLPTLVRRALSELRAGLPSGAQRLTGNRTSD
jgi:AcrR family transcriptional regulator